ncbi:hypothetical protein [Qipengyuania citrea]|uniref:hypothetical protein n=1 Tax=Qipengyuania citrea TaxID=225971 RepID=UPI003266CEF4
MNYFERVSQYDERFRTASEVRLDADRRENWDDSFWDGELILHDGEVDSALDQMVHDGLLIVNDAGDPGYRLSEQGIYEASIGGGNLVVQDQGASDTKPLQDKNVVDSSAWTGRKLVLTDEKIIRQLQKEAKVLRDRIYATRFESNSDSQDLKSLADALVAISDMAEPDLSIIDRILAHPKFRYSAALMAAVATIRGALGI